MMNIQSWYVITLETNKAKDFEQYLNIMHVSSKHTKVTFSVYKSTEIKGLTISYYITEANDYIYNFIMNKYRHLEKCMEPININNWAVKII